MASVEVTASPRTVLQARLDHVHSTGATTLDGPAERGSRIDFWRRRLRFRRHMARLLRLDAGLIEDMGLTLQEAQQEVAKPFWRL